MGDTDTITDNVAAAEARVTTTISGAGAPAATPPSVVGSADQSTPADEAAGVVPLSPVAKSRCDGFDPELGACKRDPGHTGHHDNKDGESWA